MHRASPRAVLRDHMIAVAWVIPMYLDTTSQYSSIARIVLQEGHVLQYMVGWRSRAHSRHTVGCLGVAPSGTTACGMLPDTYQYSTWYAPS